MQIHAQNVRSEIILNCGNGTASDEVCLDVVVNAQTSSASLTINCNAYNGCKSMDINCPNGVCAVNCAYPNPNVCSYILYIL